MPSLSRVVLAVAVVVAVFAGGGAAQEEVPGAGGSAAGKGGKVKVVVKDGARVGGVVPVIDGSCVGNCAFCVGCVDGRGGHVFVTRQPPRSPSLFVSPSLSPSTIPPSRVTFPVRDSLVSFRLSTSSSFMLAGGHVFVTRQPPRSPSLFMYVHVSVPVPPPSPCHPPRPRLPGVVVPEGRSTSPSFPWNDHLKNVFWNASNTPCLPAQVQQKRGRV